MERPEYPGTDAARDELAKQIPPKERAMEFNEFSWERQQPIRPGASLSATDIEAMARLLAELKEVTLSRGTYLAATTFLKRFGYEVDSSALVSPEAMAG
jgi:hypothetical protein